MIRLSEQAERPPLGEGLSRDRSYACSRVRSIARRNHHSLARIALAAVFLVPPLLSGSVGRTPSRERAKAKVAPPRVAMESPAPPNPVGDLFEAVSRCRPSLPEQDRWRIAGVVHSESQRYGYDPFFVLAMMQVESRCLPTARGIRGAIGLIQIKPSTARAVAEEAGLAWGGAQALTEPAVNVRLALRYLWQLERRFRDPYMAVAAYNLGPTRVAKMPRQTARRTTYVRKILSRYEDLLAAQTV